MNQKTGTFWGRIGILLTVVLLLASVLSGCATGKSGVTKPTIGDIVMDGSYEGMLSNTYAKDFQTTYLLLAASRGYDMTAEGFDDSKASNTEKGDVDPVTAVKNLIVKANAKAADADKVAEADYANLNETDVSKLIELFRTAVDVKPETGLQRTIGKFLNWLTTYLGFGSYIVGICVFAVIIEILMTPFAVKQQKNSIKQARLRPKEMAIRQKYAGRNDQVTLQKQQKEIQDMYAKENFSPYSGCLPLLVQLPIIFILYNIIIDPLVYVLGQSTAVSTAMSTFYAAPRAAGGLGMAALSGKSTIELLSVGIEKFSGIADFGLFSNGSAIWDAIRNLKAPNFKIGPFDFGLAPSLTRFDILLLVPVLTFVVYFFSMKLTRKFSGQTPPPGSNDRQTACSNTMMDIMMPAMSTVFTFMVPGIVGVYWMFRSVIGILKSFILAKIMPLPVFTEADYKAAAKEMAGKAPKKVEKSERAGTVRSLHHIDDEDFDDTREAALERKARMEEQEKKEQAEKTENAKKSPFGIPLLKKDRKDEQPAEKPAETPAAPAESAEETKPENETNNNGQAD